MKTKVEQNLAWKWSGGLQLFVDTQLPTDQSANQLTDLSYWLFLWLLLRTSPPCSSDFLITHEAETEDSSVSAPFIVCAIQRGRETLVN